MFNKGRHDRDRNGMVRATCGCGDGNPPRPSDPVNAVKACILQLSCNNPVVCTICVNFWDGRSRIVLYDANAGLGFLAALCELIYGAPP